MQNTQELTNGTKVCIKCEKEREISEFYTHFNEATNRNYTEARCRRCRSAAKAKGHVSLTKEQLQVEFSKSKELNRQFHEAYQFKDAKRMKQVFLKVHEFLKSQSRTKEEG